MPLDSSPLKNNVMVLFRKCQPDIALLSDVRRSQMSVQLVFRQILNIEIPVSNKFLTPYDVTTLIQ